MSKIRILPNASGTGTVTLSAPSTNTDRTITLPDGEGTVAVGTSPILQVKSATFSNSTDQTTSTTYQDSTVTLAITPTSDTNKILVSWAAVLYSNDASDGIKIRIKRTVGATNTFLADASPGHNLKQYFNVATNKHSMGMDFYLDSPATTSEVTYTIQFATYNSGSMVDFGNGTQNYKSILLQEVLG